MTQLAITFSFPTAGGPPLMTPPTRDPRVRKPPRPEPIFARMRNYFDAHPEERMTTKQASFMFGCNENVAENYLLILNRPERRSQARPRPGEGVRERMRTYFLANPDEYLTRADAAAKFGVTIQAVDVALRLLRDEGVVEPLKGFRIRAKVVAA